MYYTATLTAYKYEDSISNMPGTLLSPLCHASPVFNTIIVPIFSLSSNIAVSTSSTISLPSSSSTKLISSVMERISFTVHKKQTSINTQQHPSYRLTSTFCIVYPQICIIITCHLCISFTVLLQNVAIFYICGYIYVNLNQGCIANKRLIVATGLAFATHPSFLQSFLLLLVCVSFTIIGQPRNSVLIRRV